MFASDVEALCRNRGLILSLVTKRSVDHSLSLFLGEPAYALLHVRTESLSFHDLPLQAGIKRVGVGSFEQSFVGRMAE